MAEQFNPRTMSIKDLKSAPVDVVRTEITSLSQALGVSPAELFRALSGIESEGTGTATGTTARPAQQNGGTSCCNSDSW